MSQNMHDSRWHLDKRLNVGHLITTAMLFAGLFAWGSDVNTRLALVERDQSTLTRQVSEDLTELKEVLKEMRAEIREFRNE